MFSISPFLFLSDSRYHPIYGSFIRWVKTANKLLPAQHTSELRISVTSGLWLILKEMKQYIKHSKWKIIRNQREGIDGLWCFNKSSVPHCGSRIFIWRILSHYFLSLSWRMLNAYNSSRGRWLCCFSNMVQYWFSVVLHLTSIKSRTRSSDSVGCAMPHPGILCYVLHV